MTATFFVPNCNFYLIYAETGRLSSFLLSVDLVDMKLLWKEATLGVRIFLLLEFFTRDECCLRLKLSISVSLGTLVSCDKLTSNFTFLPRELVRLVTEFFNGIYFYSSLFSVLDRGLEFY